MLLVGNAEAAATAAAWVDGATRGSLWFARSSRDASPGGWNARIEQTWEAHCPSLSQRFAPYTDIDRTLLRWAGRDPIPTHAVELLELRCAPAERR